jgi:hypothetical protein
MAIVIKGLSKCPLCGEVLDDNLEFTLFPPFTSNTKEPLFLFSDNGVHIACLDKHPLKEKALFNRVKYHKNLPSVNSKCIIDGCSIENPSDVLAIGLLTSLETEALYKFNFITINKRNLMRWQERNEFVELVLKFMYDGKWNSLTSFNYLEYLIREVVSSPEIGLHKT